MLKQFIVFVLSLFGTYGRATPVELTDAATVLWDASHGVVYHLTLTGNHVLAAPSDLTCCVDYTLVVDQDATGGRELSFSEAGFLFANGNVPSLAAQANAQTILKFYSDGTKLTPVNVTYRPLAVPNKPATLTAVGGVGEVALSWVDASSVEDGYQVQRLDAGIWNALGTAAEPANTTSYVDYPDTPDTYTYRVVALKDGVTSTPSNTATATASK